MSHRIDKKHKFSITRSGIPSINGRKYSILAVDLNKNAKGKYIYLYYTRDPKAGQPISSIQYQRNDDFQYPNIKADGYRPINVISDGSVAEFNKGAGGDYLYLWYK